MYVLSLMHLHLQLHKPLAMVRAAMTTSALIPRSPLLSRLQHPSCVQFLGACTKQKPYIVITELLACSLADSFLKTFYVPTQRRQVRDSCMLSHRLPFLQVVAVPVSCAGT